MHIMGDGSLGIDFQTGQNFIFKFDIVSLSWNQGLKFET